MGSALREGLVLDLQSLLRRLSSFKRPVDNRQPLSKTPATHNANHRHIVAGFYGECSLALLFISIRGKIGKCALNIILKFSMSALIF